MKKHLLPILLGSALLAGTGLSAQTVTPPPNIPVDHRANERVTGHIFKPTELPAPELSQLKVPAGFKIERFAEKLGNARMLAVGPDGSVYVTRRELGDVLMLKVGANGLSDGPPTRVASRAGLHGITFHQGMVYLASPHEVFRAQVKPDGTFGKLEMIIHDLPDAGQHHTRTVQVGPDDMLYIGVGSTSNEGNEPNQESGTVLRASLDGKHRSVFASGLRDLVGWGWQPNTGEMWGVDHGMDWLGDDEQPEELNLIQKGKKYGWPYFYADNRENQHQDPPGGLTKQEWKDASVPMVMGYTAHASPMQLSFYTGAQFPAEYQGDAFISMRGSWNRKPASGYEVVRIHFQNGKAVKMEPFVTGFIQDDGEHGRLCGNVMAKDGSLLFSDDRNGVIYRVSYTKADPARAGAMMPKTPAGPMHEQNHDGVKEPLAHDTPQMKTTGHLELQSPAFAAQQMIPEENSAYDQNASVPLEWNAGPAGTKTYVILMEDPDATSTPLPIVHWVAWNLPANVTSLREGLQPMDQLQDPAKLRQGSNSNGVVGYSGPKPPEGDPAHRYFVQVFAVDREISLPPGASRREVLTACDGHVLAAGVLEGKFARPDHPKKP